MASQRIFKVQRVTSDNGKVFCRGQNLLLHIQNVLKTYLLICIKMWNMFYSFLFFISLVSWELQLSIGLCTHLASTGLFSHVQTSLSGVLVNKPFKWVIWFVYKKLIYRSSCCPNKHFWLAELTSDKPFIFRAFNLTVWQAQPEIESLFCSSCWACDVGGRGWKLLFI